MIKTISLAVISMLLAISAANAEGTTVYQEGKKFSPAEITVKRGQSVTFTNKDPVTHNVYSTTPGLAFDLKAQKTGESSEMKFDSVGLVDVQCAIHPQMKMKVLVTE